jgi:uncharacterized protein YjiS (DUF1127 family)
MAVCPKGSAPTISEKEMMSGEALPHLGFWTWSLMRALDRLDQWREAAKQRRELGALGERALKDIGIGRGEAYAEYSKSCWQQ